MPDELPCGRQEFHKDYDHRMNNLERLSRCGARLGRYGAQRPLVYWYMLAYPAQEIRPRFSRNKSGDAPRDSGRRAMGKCGRRKSGMTARARSPPPDRIVNHRAVPGPLETVRIGAQMTRERVTRAGFTLSGMRAVRAAPLITSKSSILRIRHAVPHRAAQTSGHIAALDARMCIDAAAWHCHPGRRRAPERRRRCRIQDGACRRNSHRTGKHRVRSGPGLTMRARRGAGPRLSPSTNPAVPR